MNDPVTPSAAKGLKRVSPATSCNLPPDPMAPQLDPAMLQALSLDVAVTSITSHGASGFSSTAKLTSWVGGDERLYFVKTGDGRDAETMFAEAPVQGPSGEHASLSAIHSIVPSLCPASHAHGALAASQGYFLATDFLDLSRSTSPSTHASGLSLAAKLAQLHGSPAPTPPGFSSPQFGFPVMTCCGSTEQPNDYSRSWADFFADQRLRAVLRSCERRRQGPDRELQELVEETASMVVPRLVGDRHLNPGRGVVPVVVHGDLWSGNHGRGCVGKGPVEEVVFDPSSCYAHSEYELGIMRMFGGYGDAFFAEYHALKPKDEPVDEYEDRMRLYELYHYLNHYCIFGGGYRSSAVSIMKELTRKYGQ